MKLKTTKGMFSGPGFRRLPLAPVEVPPGTRLVVELTGEISRYHGLRASARADDHQPIVEVWEFGYRSHWLKAGLHVANAHFVEDSHAV